MSWWSMGCGLNRVLPRMIIINYLHRVPIITRLLREHAEYFVEVRSRVRAKKVLQLARSKKAPQRMHVNCVVAGITWNIANSLLASDGHNIRSRMARRKGKHANRVTSLLSTAELLGKESNLAAASERYDLLLRK